jgi:glycosyltransferase involved in cell wall biosynthesis
MISVIVTTHGKDATACLASVNAQDAEHEVIEVDNDASASAARNEGFAKAKGRYVFWLDADCVLKPNILSRMRAQLECCDAFHFVYGDYERVGAFEDKTFVAGEFSLDRLLQANFVSTMSLIRRECVVPWDETIKRLEDWDFWLRVAEAGGQGYYLNDGPLFTAYYKPGDNSMEGWESYGRAFRAVAQKHLPIVQGLIAEGKIKAGE